MKVFFKILASVLTVLFLWALYVQHNDPDPYLWYALYGTAALASLGFVFNKLPFKAAWVLALAYAIGALYNWPSVFEGVEIGRGDIKNIEEGRESLGLLFCAVVFLIYSIRIKFLTR